MTRCMTVIVAALCIVTVACARGDSDASRSLPPAVDGPAPDYAATSMAGTPVSLAKLEGTPVLLNAWATWCAPCREEIPLIEGLHAKYANRGLRVVGVSLDEDTAAAPILAFVKAHDMEYEIWHDPGQVFVDTFRFSGLPMTVLVDRAGVIRWMKLGKIDPKDPTLDLAIRQVIETK